jgi:TolB protein
MRGAIAAAVLIVASAGSGSAAVERPSGLIAFTASAGCCDQVFVADLDRGRVRQVTRNGASAPSWSPDGSQLAVERVSTGPCRSPACSRIWRVAIDGSHARPVTPANRRCEEPSWSPAGDVIAYVQWEPSRRRVIRTSIYTRRPDGSGVRRLTRSPEADSDPVWSPDGKRIVFVREGRRRDSLWTMNADGTAQRRLRWLRPNSSVSSWSPDGTRLAVGRVYGTYNNETLVSVITLGRPGERVLIRRGGDPVWSPDGRFIAFVPDDEDIFRGSVSAMRADGSGRRTLFSGSFTQPYALAWHTGKR